MKYLTFFLLAFMLACQPDRPAPERATEDVRTAVTEYGYMAAQVEADGNLAGNSTVQIYSFEEDRIITSVDIPGRIEFLRPPEADDDVVDLEYLTGRNGVLIPFSTKRR